MSDEDGKILTAIQVSLARIEQNIENLTHRFRNMEQASQAFVPRREIEQAHDTLSDRIKILEDRHEAVNRWLWAAWLAGLTAVGTLARKTGLF
jgi:hypothetical protein